MTITEARLSAAQRKKVPADSFAGPHGSYPISDLDHFHAALSLAHHAPNPQAVRTKAVAIAKREGFVPEDYQLAQESVREADAMPVSHADTHDAIQRQLDAEHMACNDSGDYSDYHAPPRVSDVFPKHFTFRMGYDDAKHFIRPYSMGANGEAKLGDTAQPVVKQAVYRRLDDSEATREAIDPGDDVLHLLEYMAVATLEVGSRHSTADQQHISDITAHLGQARTHIDGAAAHVTGLGATPGAGMYAPTYGMGTLIASDDSVAESEIIESATGEAVTFHESGMTPIIREAKDAAKGHLTLRIIQPGFNTSGKRYYTKEALAEADRKKIFVGKMFIDHPTRDEEAALPERSVGKMGAQITETFLEGDGSLWGKAVVFNPALKEMLAAMQEAGVLQSAIGVSINATGRVREGTVEGKKTHIVEAFHQGKSVDFVTEPGAGGRVALMESDDSETPPVVEAQGAPTVTPEQIQAIMAQLATLTEANEKLSNQVTESDKARDAAEARATTAVQVQTRLAAIAEADLPAFAKARIQAVMEGAVNTDRLDEAITRETEYIKQARATVTAKPGVSGLGGNANRITAASGDALAPTVESAREELIAKGANLFGGKDAFTDLMKHVGVA